jgi:hypothetical protein
MPKNRRTKKNKNKKSLRRVANGEIIVPPMRRKSTATRNNRAGFGAKGTMVPWQGSAQCPVPRSMPQNTMTVRQAVNTFNTSSSVNYSGTFPQITATAGSNLYPVIAFEYQDLPQAGSFAGIFDQYKFEEVELILTPTSSVADLHGAASPNQVNPQVYAVMDFDDSTALGSFSAALQYDNAIQFDGTQGLHVRIKPAVDPALWAGGAFSGYAVEEAAWIDINSNSVPHYGIKFAVQALTALSTEFWAWNIQAWYILSLRNVR